MRMAYVRVEAPLAKLTATQPPPGAPPVSHWHSQRLLRMGFQMVSIQAYYLRVICAHLWPRLTSTQSTSSGSTGVASAATTVTLWPYKHPNVDASKKKS